MEMRTFTMLTVITKNEYAKNFIKTVSNNKFSLGIGSYNQDNIPSVTIYSNVDTVTEEDWVAIQLALQSYTEPVEYLILHHTDDHFLNTIETNSNDLTVLQSFIQSPPVTDLMSDKANIPMVLNDMKVICCLRVDNSSVLTSWDSVNDPITITFQIYDKTRDTIISTQTLDISNIALNFKNGTTTVDYKTVQIYGLRDVIDTYSCIWQFRTSISNSNIYLSINGAQKLYYQVEV